MSTQDEMLPAVGSSDNTGTERIYRTALAQRDYINLELEAMSRGLKPFGLTKSVMTLYLRKQLVLVKELPQELQDQIITHFRAKQNAATTQPR
jgi:hypothetical protein